MCFREVNFDLKMSLIYLKFRFKREIHPWILSGSKIRLEVNLGI